MGPFPPQPFVRPRPPLSDLVGAEPQFLTVVFQKLVAYARPFVIPGSTIVQCDERLRAVLGVEQIEMLEIGDMLLDLVEVIDHRPLQLP
jgi:hypothetical protein